MSINRLILRSATYHWRTNVAVALGVAAAVAVLGGALLVGDSVRGSLRDLVLSRLGRTGQVVSSIGYFRDALAADMTTHGAVSAVPMIATRAFVTHEPSQRRAAGVLVYGVDDRFWRFHGLEPRDGVFISPALRTELGVQPGDVLLTRLQKPSEIPIESLFAHKEDLGRTVRLTVTDTLAPAGLGEFSLQPQQAEVRAVFAPLGRLQRDLGVDRKVNTVLIGESTAEADGSRAFRSGVTLEDGDHPRERERCHRRGARAGGAGGRQRAQSGAGSGVHVSGERDPCRRSPGTVLAGQRHQSSRVVHLRAAVTRRIGPDDEECRDT
jgi:putative ABC transport system permease protein